MDRIESLKEEIRKTREQQRMQYHHLLVQILDEVGMLNVSVKQKKTGDTGILKVVATGFAATEQVVKFYKYKKNGSTVSMNASSTVYAWTEDELKKALQCEYEVL